MVRRLLACSGTRAADCDAFAFGSGPGSFTGLRIACTIVQGLAFATGRPVVPVGQLRALAFAGAQRSPGAGAQRILAATDARMGQAYWALYQGNEEALSEIAAPALCSQDEIAGLAGAWGAGICAGEAAWLASLVPASLRIVDARVDAGHVARLAAIDRAAGRWREAREALPEYVRDQVAQTVAQRAQARAGGGA